MTYSESALHQFSNYYKMWSLIIFFPIVCLIRFWLIAITNCDEEIKRIFKEGQKILLLIAHPDDETMFFGPILAKLKRLKADVRVMSCSNGNYYGLGERRVKELYKSCKIFGISRENVIILDNEKFQDDPNAKWDVASLRDIVHNYMDENSIKTLITFDENGVSGHVNHKALFEVAKALSSMQMDMKIFKLLSTSLLHQYSSILDLPWTYWHRKILFVSGYESVVQTQIAMTAHWSQFVWFRMLHILFSRYIIMNDLEIVN